MDLERIGYATSERVATHLCRYLLQHLLLRLRAVCGNNLFLLVEAIFWELSALGIRVRRASANSLQKLLRMRAALSLSLSSVVGQKASDPSLFERRLTGGPNLSTQPYTLSKPALLLVFVFAHNMVAVAMEQPKRGAGCGG